MKRPQRREQPSAEIVGWFRTRLSGWFALNGRSFSWRYVDNQYLVVIAEALLQRTTATAVEAFLPAFLRRFPTWEAIREAKLDELEAQLRPVGLWRRRAASLKELSTRLVEADGLPASHEELLGLPGVGQYIANAVSLVVHGERRALLDSNMARVLERFFGARQLVDIRYDPYLQELASRVVDAEDAKAINWAILDLAAAICRPRPRCEACPLAKRCRTGLLRSAGTVATEALHAAVPTSAGAQPAAIGS